MSIIDSSEKEQIDFVFGESWVLCVIIGCVHMNKYLRENETGQII